MSTKNKPANTNTAPETKTADAEPTAAEAASLFKIHEAWVKAGSVMPNAPEKAAMLKAYKDAQGAVDAAEKALEAAKLRAYDAAAVIIRATGAVALNIEGSIHQPATRNGKMFFRTQGQKDIVKF